MLKILRTVKKKSLNRRDFLSRTTAIGSMALLGISTGPVQAIEATMGLQKSATTDKNIHPGNATANDFADLVGQRFHLQIKDGTAVHAKLIEANSPQTLRALRFRREHFSIVFDVPDGLELFQGQYILSHPQIGLMELFMVPVDLPAKHRRLEAVFS